MTDQFKVEWQGPEGWCVEEGFSDYGDALEYLNDMCAKRFQTKPREVMSADFDYRICEGDKVWLTVSFRIELSGRGPLQ